MFVLAITGGLGAGKSTATGYLQSRGAEVLALDDVAKGVVAEHPAVLWSLVDRFGPCVIDESGAVDRAALAEVAFASRRSAADLDSIVHPATLAETQRLLAELASREVPPRLVVVEVPLLVEVPAFLQSVDEVLAIAAPEEVRVCRAVKRGMAEEDARHRIACQASDEERGALADVVLDNDGDLASFEAAVAGYYEERIVPRLAP